MWLVRKTETNTEATLKGKKVDRTESVKQKIQHEPERGKMREWPGIIDDEVDKQEGKGEEKQGRGNEW